MHPLFRPESIVVAVAILAAGCEETVYPPSVQTTDVTSILGNSAIVGGEVLNDGGAQVSQRGVCWDTDSIPAFGSSCSTEDGGVGAFVSSIDGLLPHTSYRVRAYAINEKGIGYGDEVLFETTNEGGGVQDMDGNTYTSVFICNQEWMAQNLRTSKFSNGDAIPEAISNEDWNAPPSAKWCWYENNPANEAVFGKLYNGFTVADERNVCPDGWRIPNLEDWKGLALCLDPDADVHGEAFYSSVAGGMLKMQGSAGWIPPNLNATNSSGFNGVGGGLRLNSPGVFNSSLRLEGFFWGHNGSCFRLKYEHGAFRRTENHSLGTGFSIRCIKD